MREAPKSNGPSTGSATGRTAVVPPVKTSWARIQLADATAKASVATARNSPRTRSAGMPMTSAASAPSSVHNTTAVPQFSVSDRSKAFSGMGMSCPLVSATRQNAPRPTKANCPSEIWPAQPVSRVSERATMVWMRIPVQSHKAVGESTSQPNNPRNRKMHPNPMVPR